MKNLKISKSLVSFFFTLFLIQAQSASAYENYEDLDYDIELFSLVQAGEEALERYAKENNLQPLRSLSEAALVYEAVDSEELIFDFYVEGQPESYARIQAVPFNEEDPELGPWRFRVFGGTYTPIKLNEIVRGRISTAETRVRGLEVGRVIISNFRGWPLDLVASIGSAHHDDGSYQPNFWAFTTAVRAEWKSFPWNHVVRTQAIIGQGFNYAERVPYFEGENVRPKSGGRDSRLMNYLGVGLGFNMGDLFGSQSLKNCYIGGYVYHRSGVFGKPGIYNNVSGGSNYNTIYIQCASSR